MAKEQTRNRSTDATDALVQLSSGVLSTGFNLAAKAITLPLDVAEGVLDELNRSKDLKKAAGQPTNWPQAELDALRFTPPLFTLDLEHSKDLPLFDDIKSGLLEAFKKQGYALSHPEIMKIPNGYPDREWTIFTDGDDKFYRLKNMGRHLRVEERTQIEIKDLPLGPEILNELQKNVLPQEWREPFQKAGITLSAGATVSGWTKGAMTNPKNDKTPSEPIYLIAGQIIDETNTYQLQGFDDGPLVITTKFVFTAELTFREELNQMVLSEDLRQVFEKNEHPLPKEAEILFSFSALPPIRWHIKDAETKYTIINKGRRLYVYRCLGQRQDDEYVDPEGDRIIERFLGLDSDTQYLATVFGYFDYDDMVDAALGIKVFQSLHNPYQILRWLRGQSDDVDPITYRKTLGFVQEYFDYTERLPSWANAGLLAKAEEVFKHHKMPYMLVLLFKSLPETYACWRGAQVLTTTNRLVVNPDDATHNQAARLGHRVMASGQFVLNVMQPNGFNPGGPGIRTTQVLRLVHAGVRFIVRNVGVTQDPDRPPWDYERLGEPINQEDLLMTMLAFSTVVMDGMKKLDVYLKPDEEDAIFHRWKVMGYYLGIREDLLEKLETADDGRALWNAIVAKQQDYRQGSPTPDEIQAGINLTDALITYAQTITKGKLPRDVPECLIRHLVGDDLADKLGLPQITRLEPRVLTLLARLGWGVMHALSDQSLVADEFFQALKDATSLSLFDDWFVEHPVTFYKTADADETRATKA